MNIRQRQQSGSNKKRHTGGFTLVELVVVLVVLAILCTLAVFGIHAWQDHADFKKQNEYARNIFVAAQTQLTQYGERGQLTLLKDAITNDEKADVKEYLLDAQGVLTADEDIWIKDETGKTQKGDICFLKVRKGDYKKYLELKQLTAAEMKKKTPEERRIRAMFDMLDPYIADKEMLNAAICIEFDPDPKVALIYSVFFNEKINEFTYGEKSDTLTGVASIRDRREESRKDLKTGYYGANVLAKGSDTNIARPTVSKLRLNNEDTLNLSWTVNSEDALMGLIYTINIYALPESNTEGGVKLAAITMGKGEQKELVVNSDSQVECVLSYPVTGADGKTVWNDKPMRFPVSVNRSERSMKLVLDGLDLIAEENAAPVEMESTASIARLGLNAENIYASIVGSRPSYYDMTVEKKSNTEHQFFGTMQIKTDAYATRVFTVENARHLNNIRFYEKKYKHSGRSMIYRATADIDWKMALDKGSTYERMTAISATAGEQQTDRGFRPILQLGKTSSFLTDATEQPHVLKNFRFEEKDVPITAPEDAVPAETVGLFVLNKGQISNLTLDAVTVNGNTNPKSAVAGATGAFCGKNEGVLSNLTVLSGTVTGDVSVGGIAGETVSALEPVMYENLTNRAMVTGRLYVGGITGKLRAEVGAVTVKNCRNYGKIRGEGRSAEEDAYYIGGIAGYSEALSGTTLRLSGCSSSPAYTEEEISSIIAQIKAGDNSPLSGIYVGGIVGLNKGAILENCNTLRETTSKNGYVIGKDFVGGIAGFNAGTAGSALSGGTQNKNQANVIGSSYVGGIVGCNAGGNLNADHSIVLKQEYNPDIRIENWTNEGIVLAVGDYSGGITGSNHGQVIDCNSNVDYSSTMHNLTEVSSSAGFAGGIAGYNNGVLAGSDQTVKLQTVSVISGSNYVGGIVGYNDKGGRIDHYQLKGGYIHGKKFVGGYIGLNADAGVLNHMISGSPNEVSGEYFVGGIIGGNLIATDQNIYATLATDNFMGSLNAESGAFAGGFIGYNYLLHADTNEAVIRTAADSLCQELKPIADGTPEELDNRLQYIETPLLNFLKPYANSTTTMQIQGVQTGEYTQTRLSEVTALVYAGGVVGYNQESTSLVIQDVENVTPVTATAYITRREAGMAERRRYSYAGGIVGKVAENVTLIRCRNRDEGEVRTQGTYTGGLAEINYGLVKECEAGSLGDGTKSHIGGLVGVNMAKGDGTGAATKGIVDGKITGTIMGIDYVGGLAAENYGDIVNPDARECRIEASGTHIGGIAGYGQKDSRIHLGTKKNLDINISGSGSNVGGVVGTNAGSMTGTEISIGAGPDDDSSIIGQRNVGGFIGVQEEAPVRLERFSNYAHVQAEEGYAGGIVARTGRGAEASRLYQCENFNEITVLSQSSGDTDLDEIDDSSAAGGITAVNRGTISECRDFANVQASGGYSGGIAAINYGTIQKSQVNDGGRDLLEMEGDLYVGGIAAINEKGGKISDSSVQNVILKNQTSTSGGYVGGITGENRGEIIACSVGVEGYLEKQDDTRNYEDQHLEAAGYVSDAARRASANPEAGYHFTGTNRSGDNSVILYSNGADTAIGGIAGLNTGKIRGSGKHDGFSVVAAELRFTGNGTDYYGNMGGIAGVNEGEIRSYEFNGFIHGAANNPRNPPEFNPNDDYEKGNHPIYGYGGIVGLNGSDSKAQEAFVSDCMVNFARIQGTGDTNNRTNVGGVAGVNGAEASISGIRYGLTDEGIGSETMPNLFAYRTDKKTYQGAVWVGTDGYGHAGGVAGYNMGSIRDINDWNDYKRNRENYFKGGVYTGELLSEADHTGVLVVNAAGHVGGIAGYNQRPGIIGQVVTGRNWLTIAEKQGQGDGAGGIIGFNSSEKNQEYCDNHGTVIKTAASSDAVGGMTGRNEISTGSAWRFYECRNYGTIEANLRAGGMIGTWKNRGGTLENCQNYGSVFAGGEGSAGMVGMFIGMADGETANLTGCENHGTIRTNGANAAAGMVAMAFDHVPNLKINLYGCINTGLIGSSSAGAGMLARIHPAVMQTLSYCRNYGYSLNGANNNFAGMTIHAPVSIRESFGVTDRSAGLYPLYNGAASTTDGAYYFASSNPADVADDNKYGIPLYISQTGDHYTAKNAATGDVIDTIGIHTEAQVLLSDKVSERTKDSTLAYQLYQSLDQYLVIRKEVPKLDIPTGVQSTDQGGYYLIGWDEVEQAEYYEVTCAYYGMADGIQTMLGKQVHKVYQNQLPMPIDYQADGIHANQVQVQVKAYATAGYQNTVSSKDWSEPLWVEVGLLLPTPQVNWELTSTDNPACYRIVLDNQEEYASFIEENRLSISLDDIQIHTYIGTKEPDSFSAADGALLETDGSNRLKEGIDTENIFITSYAVVKTAGEGDKKIGQSVKMTAEGRIPLNSHYRKQGNGVEISDLMGKATLEKTEKTNLAGFFGSTIDSLSYRTVLGSNAATGGWGINYRTELVATDPVLGIPVAYAVSPQTRTSPANQADSQIILSGLPGDFLDKNASEEYIYKDIYVRMYPTRMTDGVLYQGWQIRLPDGGEGLTAEALEALKVTDDGRISETGSALISKSKFTKNVKLKTGYVVESAGGGLYTLYYNTLIKELMDHGGYSTGQERKYTHNDQKSTCMFRQVVYHSIDLAKELEDTQPEPVFYADAVFHTAANLWQDGSYDETSPFVLTWDQPDYVNVAGKYPYDQNGEYRITVKGTLPNGSVTTLVNNKTYKTAESEEEKANTCSLNAEKWNYTKISVSLTRVGEVDEAGVVTRFPVTKEREFPMRLRLSTIGKPAIGLQKDENGVILKDGLDFAITFSGLADQKEFLATSAYRVTITGKESQIVKDDILVTPTLAGAKEQVMVNLSGFKRGEKIGITVKAVAKPKTENAVYRDGMEGTRREMDIPQRLMAPEMGAPDDGNSNLTADVRSNVSQEEFLEESLFLKMQPDNYSNELNVRYQVAFQLFDDAGTQIEGVKLPDKEDAVPVYMEKGTDCHTYSLKEIPAEYAGMYIRVFLRSVSSSNISSVWTDEDQDIAGEDETYSAVTPYRIFRLPDVQADTVVPADDTESRSYQILTGGGNGESAGEVQAEQQVISFHTVPFADDYHIMMIQNPQQADRTASSANSRLLAADVNELTIRKNGDETYQIQYTSTEGWEHQKPELQILNVGGEIELPYRKQILLDAGTPETSPDEPYYYVEVHAVLRADAGDDGEVQFHLTLPDFLELTDESAGGSVAGNTYTEQILVQAQVTGTKNRYLSSKWARMTQGDGTGWSSEPPVEMNRSVEEPSGFDTSVEVTPSGVYKIAYQITGITGKTRYLMRAMQGGKLIGEYAVPYQADATDSYDAQIWFPASDFSRYAGQEITLSFRSVFGSSTGGLSADFGNAYPVMLPLLPEADTVVLTQQLSDEQEYEVAAAARRKSASARQGKQTLTVKQYQVVWTYLLSETMVAGYDLTIHGETMASDYRLKLDLRRDGFGGFPGLTEYQKDGGKVLYAAAYDMDGDLNFMTPESGIVASGSNADFYPETAATASNSDEREGFDQIGVIYLECKLQANLVTVDGEEAIRFTLTLPDVSLRQLNGAASKLFQAAFEDGLYSTERISVMPVMINRYYELPEQEWYYLEKSMAADLEEQDYRADSEDGTLVDDVTQE